MAKYIFKASFPSLILLISLLAIIRLSESDQMGTTATVLSEQLSPDPEILSQPLPPWHETDFQQKINCDEACNVRCQLSSRPKMCKRACMTCCARCECVPPGTSGGYDTCPCYANMTTHGGRHKCP